VRTKRVARHKSNGSKDLKGLNIGLTYVLVGREFRKEERNRHVDKFALNWVLKDSYGDGEIIVNVLRPGAEVNLEA